MKFVAIAMMLALAGTCSTVLGEQSSVSVTNLSVKLTDLDGNGGVTPPLQTESTETFAGAQIAGMVPSGGPPVDGFLVPLEAVASSPDSPFASASATVSDDATGPAITVDASSTDLGFATAYAGSIGLLFVPAHTSATFSADFSFMGMGPDVLEQAQVCLGACITRVLSGPGAADFILTWTFTNEYGGAYPALIDVYASAFAAGIPEPGEPLMMLAGLALICAIATRRRAAVATSGEARRASPRA